MSFRLWFSLLFAVISGLSIPFLPAASPVQDTIDVAMYFDHGEGQEISGLPNEQFPIRLNDEQLKLARQTGFIVQKGLETGSETGRLQIVVQDMTTGAAGSILVPVEN